MNKLIKCRLCNFKVRNGNPLASMYLHLSRRHQDKNWQKEYEKLGGVIKDRSASAWSNSQKSKRTKIKTKTKAKRKRNLNLPCPYPECKLTGFKSKQGLSLHMNRSHGVQSPRKKPPILNPQSNNEHEIIEISFKFCPCCGVELPNAIVRDTGEVNV